MLLFNHYLEITSKFEQTSKNYYNNSIKMNKTIY